jgi:hypothetical protein
MIGDVHRMTLPIVAVTALLCAALLPDRAEAEEDYFQPIALGMGGAVRVLGADISAIHLNPASMTGKPVYLGGSSYTFYGREKSHTIASGSFDSRTSAFAMGIGYTVHTFDPPFDPKIDLKWYPVDTSWAPTDKRTFQRWDFAFGYGFLQRKLNVGVSARIVHQTFEIRTKRTFFTMDAGITAWPLEFLAFGISVQNFIPTKDDRYPIRLSPGVAVEVKDLLKIGFDFVFDFTSQGETITDIHGGAELTLFRLVGIRAGYYSDREFTDNYITWGLGLRIERAKLSINFGMRIEVGPMEKRLRLDKPAGNQRILNSIGFDLSF